MTAGTGELEDSGLELTVRDLVHDRDAVSASHLRLVERLIGELQRAS
jgi:hypothetical protein